MRKCHLDFESRSRVDIWASSAYVYASDPSTEIMCLAYAVDNGEVKVIRYSDFQMYPLVDPFEELRELATADDTLFYAHNAIFERFIWEHKLRAFGLPEMPIAKWRCTAAKALAHGLPKALKDVASVLKVGEQKDMGGRAVMLKVCKPKSDGTWNEDPELIQQLEDYCAQDVRTERAVDERLPELSVHEQHIWFEDQLINERGIAVDRDAMGKALTLIDQETEYLKDQIRVLTDGKLEGVSRRNAVLAYFKKNGVDLPDFTKATVETALKSGKIPARLAEVLRIRQQLGLTSTAKYVALKDALCPDLRLRDTLVYHSASTGRWGGKLVQLQNLPRGTVKDTDEAIELIKTTDIDTLRMLYGNIMGLLSSCIRGMFVAEEGKELIVADYSAIEARVLMWLAGQTDAVKMFAEGKDIYVEMARRVYSNPKLTFKDKKERTLGKQITLGCGFGMSYLKFQITCDKAGIDLGEKTVPVYGWKKGEEHKIIGYVAPMAVTSVDTYRRVFSKVPKMWYSVEQAMRTAIETHRGAMCGKIMFEWGGEFLYAVLPSGRKIAYHNARIKNGKIVYNTTNSKTKKYQTTDIFGSKIAENIVQATARDIMAWAMVRVEKAGYPIVLTVHDELVAEVPKGKKSLEEFIKILTHIPKWAEGCPISAEGWVGKRYKK